ncbi:hypothetical protein PGT21_004248 [Puccinia graminis f. sp. tritici]|uniref:Uncharacterized protein n=1 Tax=Puccinia graminis f. sp. tritici TaxID=56615 RepID=A0A5B0N6E2_PUCGR|nr:hypothetical protein PGT21_004248 [Puccinia graminis f. sp. tritici]
MSSPANQNDAQSTPMPFAHSSSAVEPEQNILKEKRLDALEVTEKSSPSNSLQQILPPPEWKYAKFFPGGYSPTRQLPFKGQNMTWAVNIVAGIAIMFYGFDQGVMSGVNNTINYQETRA